MILELTQTIWLQTPKGQALAKFLIDRGDESDLLWVCFHKNGECWTWMNTEIRASQNITMGRKSSEENNINSDLVLYKGHPVNLVNNIAFALYQAAHPDDKAGHYYYLQANIVDQHRDKAALLLDDNNARNR